MFKLLWGTAGPTRAAVSPGMMSHVTWSDPANRVLCDTGRTLIARATALLESLL